MSVDPISHEPVPPGRSIVIEGIEFDAESIAQHLEHGNRNHPLLSGVSIQKCAVWSVWNLVRAKVSFEDWMHRLDYAHLQRKTEISRESIASAFSMQASDAASRALWACRIETILRREHGETKALDSINRQTAKIFLLFCDFVREAEREVLDELYRIERFIARETSNHAMIDERAGEKLLRYFRIAFFSRDVESAERVSRGEARWNDQHPTLDLGSVRGWMEPTASTAHATNLRAITNLRDALRCGDAERAHHVLYSMKEPERSRIAFLVDFCVEQTFSLASLVERISEEDVRAALVDFPSARWPNLIKIARHVALRSFDTTHVVRPIAEIAIANKWTNVIAALARVPLIDTDTRALLQRHGPPACRLRSARPLSPDDDHRESLGGRVDEQRAAGDE